MIDKLEKVLLVDDDPILLKIGSISLGQVKNCQVILASSGAQSISLAQSENPQVILLDVVMPEKDGVATYKELREIGVKAPIIFMTANDNEDDLKTYKEMGAAGIIVKPFDVKKLPDQICQILFQLEKTV